MPTTLYASQPQPNMASAQNDDDNLFFDSSMSSAGNSLFPPDMLDASSLLNVPGAGFNMDIHQQQQHQQHLRHSPSISGASDTLSPSAYQQAFSISGSSSSRLPSLSPSTQSMHLSASGHGHSPRSTSSPSSNSTFSLSATDDFFNSFSSTELDMLFLADENSPTDFNAPIEQNSKPGQSLNLPGFGGQHQRNPSNSNSNPFSTDSISSFDFLQNLLQTSSYNNGFAQDGSMDGNGNLGMLNLDPSMSINGSHRKVSDVSDTSPMLNFDFAQQARAIGNIGGQTQPQPGLQTQSTSHIAQPQVTSISGGQNGWTQPMANGQLNSEGNPSSQQTNHVFGQTSPAYNDVKPQLALQQTKPKTKSSGAKARAAPQDFASEVPTITAPAVPTVGKHNKTERRYRQKVQAAQADLRDAIPALRVLYETSTEEQKLATDFRAADGTVDGLGEVTRPNASAKATILIGARMYIELLQKRSAMLQRKVDELEAFRSAVAGEEDFRQWQADFDSRERQIQAAADAAAAQRMDDDSLDEDEEAEEEEEENERKRKKPKTSAAPKAPRAKPGPKSKKAQAATIAQTAADGGLRVFAAFAMSFSFIPSASDVLKQTSTTTATAAGQVLPSGAVGTASTRQILSRIPLITAEHTSRLLARGLPAPLVPTPHGLLDWTWRVLVAVILAVSMGPIIAKWTKENNEKRKAGNLSLLARECANLGIPRTKRSQVDNNDEVYWTQLAAGIVGGSVKPSTLERWHVILHLNNTAIDAYSLTLLALLQPELPLLRSPQQIWRRAQSKLDLSTSPALATVLRLPLAEAHRCAHLLEKTSSPIAAIAEQITLVHVHDLYSRFFIRLVDASTRSRSTSSSSLSTKNLLANLESCDIGSNLKLSAFDREIRNAIQGLPRGSAAHALGLVLIGLWGIFTRPAPKAQAALASALAAEEVQGAGAGLSSVSAMLELLYPGSRDVLASKGVDQARRAARLPKNALAIDKLATACIDYIKLLTSSAQLNEPELTRVQRMEASRKVQKDTAHLRLVLTQTKFIGVTGDLVEHDIIDERYSDSGSETGDESEATQAEAAGVLDHAKDVGLENEGRKFAIAKERLVKVLCVVGRRAAGRASGRDDDSGLEGDLDDL
ncbi:hypothetical protein IAU59_005429 [Kwoniella sp. CBS 9459]